MNVEEKLAAIEAQVDLQIAYDGCHKMYLVENEEQADNAIETGYRLYAATEVRTLWEESCALRFINRWALLDGQWTNEFTIEQFEDEPEDEPDEALGEEEEDWG